MFHTLWGPSVSTDDINSPDNILASTVSRVERRKSRFIFDGIEKGNCAACARQIQSIKNARLQPYI